MAYRQIVKHFSWLMERGEGGASRGGGWIDLSDQARTGVSNSANEALKSLGLPLELCDSID